MQLRQWTRLLLSFGQTQGQAGLFTICGGAVDDARFGGLVESRGHLLERLGSIIAFARAEQIQITSFQRVQTRFDGTILRMFARAIAHSPFGRLRIGHKNQFRLLVLRGETVAEEAGMSTG